MWIRIIDAVTLVLLIVGGVTWGLVGLFDFNPFMTVLELRQHDVQVTSTAARILYGLFGLSALWQVWALLRRVLVPEQR